MCAVPRGLLACMLLAAIGGTPEAAAQWRLDGYAKDLALVSRSVVDDDAYFLNLGRLRLQGSASRGTLHAEAWWDTEWLAGSWFSAPEAALGRQLASSGTSGRPFADLDWTISDGPRHTLDQRLFRATVAWSTPRAVVTVGRQRVAWGTGFVWTPTDVLHPLEPAAIERDEKRGVDAIQIVLPDGSFGAAELVFAPGRSAGAHRFAGRVRGHVGEYDVTAMGGRFGREWVVGGDFAGYVGTAGFRGEAAVTRTASGRWTLRATANVDHMPAESVYGFIELHFNGPGEHDVAQYEWGAMAQGDLVNVGRWYAASAIAWTVTPLVSVSGYVVHNLGDGSSLLGPIVTWSAAENLDASAGYYLFRGGRTTEYGAAHDAAFLTLQYFF